jgi:uncharacterized protein (UPF0254 family)
MTKELITIATAECFTHGKVAQEIHSFSQGYPLNYSWNLNPDEFKLSVIGSVFAPTISGVKSLLQIEPLPPITTIDDIKVYDEEGDLKMAFMMAKAVRNITGANIGIGTTAGIGKGGIAVCNESVHLSCTSDINADLRTSSTGRILKRQQSGIEKALFLLENLIKDNMPVSDSEKINIHFHIEK